MTHRLALLVLVAALVGLFALAAQAHTTPPHNCLSSAHGWQTDGTNLRHNAVVTLTPDEDGFIRKVTVNHQSKINGVWTPHAGNTYSCLVA